MQHRITKPSDLLDTKGRLIQKGYATSPILRYIRKNVAKKSRLKEWDYYLVYNKNYAIGLTISKTLRLVLISVSLINFNENKEISINTTRIVRRKFKMPEASLKGDIIYKSNNIRIEFRHEETIRVLLYKKKGNLINPNLDISLVLYNEPQDSMIIATPFPKSKKQFYYNRKIIGIRASGYARYDGSTYFFSPVSSFGLLDWGRGVWPYITSWYWGAAQGVINGILFGFNLGYGFGDTSAATENMLFYKGTASKLSDVTFHIPRNSKGDYEYMRPWRITSSDKRIEMVFEPIYERKYNLNALVLSTEQHQVFGKYTGTAILDDDTKINFQDFFGFAERVSNRW